MPGELGAEGLVERLRLAGGGRAGEARAVSLRGVRYQRELADDERRAAGLEQAPVEPALLVLEDPQVRDPACEPSRLGRPVAASRSVSLSKLAGIAFYEKAEIVMRAQEGKKIKEIE